MTAAELRARRSEAEVIIFRYLNRGNHRYGLWDCGELGLCEPSWHQIKWQARWHDRNEVRMLSVASGVQFDSESTDAETKEWVSDRFRRFVEEVIRRFTDVGWKIEDTDWYGINATQYEIQKPSGEVVRIWTPVWGEWDDHSKTAMALVACALGQTEEELMRPSQGSPDGTAKETNSQ